MPRRHISKPRTTQVWKRTSKNSNTFDRIVSKLREAGYNDYEISGIVGNFIQESGYNFNMFNDARKGYAHMATDDYNLMKKLYKDELDYYIDWGAGNVDKNYADSLGYLQGQFKPGTFNDTQSASDQFLKNFERAVIKDKATKKVIGYQNQDERRQFAGDVYNQLLNDRVSNWMSQHGNQMVDDMRSEKNDATFVDRNIQMPVAPYDDPNIPNTIERTGAMVQPRTFAPKYDLDKVIQPFQQPYKAPIEYGDEATGFDEGKNPNSYTAKKGDSLWRIARRYTGRGARYKELLQENDIKNPNFIRIGQNIVIPESWMKPVRKEKEEEQKKIEKEVKKEQKKDIVKPEIVTQKRDSTAIDSTSIDRPIIQKPDTTNTEEPIIPEPSSRGQISFDPDTNTYSVIAKGADRGYKINRNALDADSISVDLDEVVVTGKDKRKIDKPQVDEQNADEPTVVNRDRTLRKVKRNPYANFDTIKYKTYENNKEEGETVPQLEYTTEKSKRGILDYVYEKHKQLHAPESEANKKRRDEAVRKAVEERNENVRQQLGKVLGGDLGGMAANLYEGKFKEFADNVRTGITRKLDNGDEEKSESLKDLKIAPKINKPVVSKDKEIKKPKESEVINEDIAKNRQDSIDIRWWKNEGGVRDASGDKFYSRRSIPITDDMRFGVRARGEHSDLPSRDAMFAMFDNDGEKGKDMHKFYTYDEVMKKGIHKWENYMKGRDFIGVDKDGRFIVGDISKFKPGSKMKVIRYADVTDIPRQQNGDYVWDTNTGNKDRAAIKVDATHTMPLMTAKKSKTGGKYVGDRFNNVAGGSVLLVCGSEKRLVTGSIDDIVGAHDIMRKNHKGKSVRWYFLDPGSYSRGLRTNGRNINAQDTKDYDAQNPQVGGAGGNFIYLINN